MPEDSQLYDKLQATSAASHVLQHVLTISEICIRRQIPKSPQVVQAVRKTLRMADSHASINGNGGAMKIARCWQAHVDRH
jgi:hypothetical protein